MKVGYQGKTGRELQARGRAPPSAPPPGLSEAVPDWRPAQGASWGSFARAPDALPEWVRRRLPVWVTSGGRNRGTSRDVQAGTMADGGSERADGRIVKMEVDYSATVDQRLPECEKLAKVRGGRLAVRGRQGLSHGAELA